MRPGADVHAWACSALLLLVSTTVQARGVAARQAWFEGFDRDGDGRISLAEYERYFSAGFDALDRNGDGRLDQDELPTSRQRSPTRERNAHRRAVQRAFARLDTDQNGWLSLSELTAPPR